MQNSQSDPFPLLWKVRNYQDSRRVRALGLYPYFRPISSAQDTEVIVHGKKVLMLGSNSYLGLTNHPEIKEAVKKAVDKYGSGCAGSRFLNGTLDIHLQLEEELAKPHLGGIPRRLLQSADGALPASRHDPVVRRKLAVHNLQ